MFPLFRMQDGFTWIRRLKDQSLPRVGGLAVRVFRYKISRLVLFRLSQKGAL